jgi:hypothetical protein
MQNVMSGYQIRLELLKMAKEMLEQEFFNQKETVNLNWEAKVEAAKATGEPTPIHPGFPTYPSENDIINKAQNLNGFVSNQPTTSPIIKSNKKSV